MENKILWKLEIHFGIDGRNNRFEMSVKMELPLTILELTLWMLFNLVEEWTTLDGTTTTKIGETLLTVVAK